jgi:hypothetical protein
MQMYFEQIEILELETDRPGIWTQRGPERQHIVAGVVEEFTGPSDIGFRSNSTKFPVRDVNASVNTATH